jgi:hypothetical protein
MANFEGEPDEPFDNPMRSEESDTEGESDEEYRGNERGDGDEKKEQDQEDN